MKESIPISLLDKFIKEAAIKSRKRFAEDYLLYLLEKKLLTRNQYQEELQKVSFIISEIDKSKAVKEVSH